MCGRDGLGGAREDTNLKIPAGGGNTIPSKGNRELELHNYERQLQGLPPVNKISARDQLDFQVAGKYTGSYSNRSLGPAGSYGTYKQGDIESNGSKDFIYKDGNWVPLA